MIPSRQFSCRRSTHKRCPLRRCRASRLGRFADRAGVTAPRGGVNVAPVHDEGSPVTVDPVRRAWEAIDFRTPLVVRALADTGLFAALAEGSATTAHLAPACSLHPGSLERALHLLIAADILRRTGDAWESSDGREVTASTRRCLTRSPGTWSSSSLTELRL